MKSSAFVPVLCLFEKVSIDMKTAVNHNRQYDIAEEKQLKTEPVRRPQIDLL